MSEEVPEGEVQPLVEIHDSERLPIARALADVQERWSRRAATPENLKSMAEEFYDRFREIGFEVTVNPFAVPVSVTIEARLAPFDHERQARDVRAGVADEYWDRRRRIAEARRQGHVREADRALREGRGAEDA